MKFQEFRVVLALLGLASLAACTDSSITAVKEASVRQSDFTFGQVFDKAKGCRSTDWEASTDADGRKVVDYTCTTELSAEALEKGRQANAEKIMGISKQLTDAWSRAHDEIEGRQRTVGDYLQQERAQVQERLQELLSSAQKEQQRLDQASAMPPTAFVGHGPSGPTPKLLAEGEERKRIAMQESERQLTDLRRKIEGVQRELDALADPTQYRPEGGKSSLEYAQALQKMDTVKDKYFAALSGLEAPLRKQAQDHVDAQQKRSLKLKVRFLVPNKSAVEPVAAAWHLDGERKESLGVVFLAAAILKPSYLPQIIDSKWAQQLAMPLDSWKTFDAFPYRCGREVSTGCEPKVPA